MDRPIRNISRQRFDAYIYVREAWLPFDWEEVEWLDSFNGKLLAVIARHRQDGDFAVAFFARDARKMFRLHKYPLGMYETQAKAYSVACVTLLPYEYDPRTTFEESPINRKNIDLFKPLVPPEKLHPFFKMLAYHRHYEPARILMEECLNTFVDVDRNFVKDFQSTEFNSRLWELFLHIYLLKKGFKINRSHQTPDFCLNYYGKEIYIEAVIVNHNNEFDEPPPETEEDIARLLVDYVPIKYGRTLTRKRDDKRYWELNHVKGKPFILAIHDYHDQGTDKHLGSMTWTRTALVDYLYGIREIMVKGKNGKPKPKVKITSHGPVQQYEHIPGHIWKGKGIPSGFFTQKDSENISAVLFTNDGTLSTFNRMGELAGFNSHHSTTWRIMTLLDNSTQLPIIKTARVEDPDYEESWGEGLTIYHNPNALHPLDPSIFPDAAHFRFDYGEEEFSAIYPEKYVLSSFTQKTMFVKDNEETPESE